MPSSTEAWGRSTKPGAPALIEGMEHLRQSLQLRLEQIEALARDRAESAAHGDSERARLIQQRFAEMEDTQRRLRAESERWERERLTAVEQLEHDRRLLAEAWERLEREQLENHAHARQSHAEQARPVVLHTTAATDGDDPVAQAILRQFKALSRDVRRNSQGHRRN